MVLARKVMNQIIEHLKLNDSVIGILGLGSNGIESNRFDQYSDLDFFVFVKKGTKKPFLKDLSWLLPKKQIAYQFKNTVDGFKFMTVSRVFGEMAIFELSEMKNIPFSKGKIFWVRSGYKIPDTSSVKINQTTDVDYLANECLTNLLIGVSRFRRGEKLAAFKMVQVYALENLLKIIKIKSQSSLRVTNDVFAVERRFEHNYPKEIKKISKMIKGYDQTLESAHDILKLLEKYHEVNETLKESILDLIK